MAIKAEHETRDVEQRDYFCGKKMLRNSGRFPLQGERAVKFSLTSEEPSVFDGDVLLPDSQSDKCCVTAPSVG